MAKGMVIWRNGANGKMKVYLTEAADAAELDKGDIAEFATNPNNVAEGNFVQATVQLKAGYHDVFDTATNPAVINPVSITPPGPLPGPNSRGQIVNGAGNIQILRNVNPKTYTACNIGAFAVGDCVGFGAGVPATITGTLNF